MCPTNTFSVSKDGGFGYSSCELADVFYTSEGVKFEPWRMKVDHVCE